MFLQIPILLQLKGPTHMKKKKKQQGERNEKGQGKK
jgi:hypothetical protein